jgi:serine/threonine protein kinase
VRAVPTDTDGLDPIDRLAESVVARLRAGQSPDPDDYAARYPTLASQVAGLLPALAELEENRSAGGDDDRPPPGPADGDDAPRQLGEYAIVREIGRGGMGVVYEAVQESLGRHVALKVLQPGSLSPAHLERFRREARAAARLHHTNIVPVYGVGEHGGVHFYAMQFIRGQSVNLVIDELRRLRAASRGRALPPPGTDGRAPDDGVRAEWSASSSGAEFYRAVARVGLQAAEALDYAHSHGVLHRDVKPSNLLLDGHGAAWITDFGLAKSEGTHDLTETGDVVGTLHYMPPERQS